MDDAIGIIGAGRLGQALARTARRADRPVVIANSRGPESLTSLVDALGPGVTAGTTQDAAHSSIVALAVPWAAVHDALAELSWSDEIVIDASNAVLLPSLEPVSLGGLTSSEIVAQLVPGARVVKAANTLAADVLGADAREVGGRRVLFVSGDNAEAKRAVPNSSMQRASFRSTSGTSSLVAPCSRREDLWRDTTSCGCPRRGNDGTPAPIEIR